jgi:hypothetical protein
MVCFEKSFRTFLQEWAVKVLRRMNCLPLLYESLKDDVNSVLRISSAHNKGGPPDINIAHILHLLNFFELKRIVYIHLQV